MPEVQIAAPIAVLTRDREGAAPYAAALAPLGLAVIAMPVTRTEPPPDRTALARALGDGAYAAIACASPRAAAALVEARAAAVAMPPVWAVGPATARVLAAAQIAAIAPAQVRDGAGLARAMIAAGVAAGARVLVPRAADGRDDAVHDLRAAGAEIVEVIAYRTVATPADDAALVEGRAAIARGGAAICVVFAPSQVAALAALADVRPLTFAAIGETTAAALRAAGATVIAVAAAPTPEGIANAVASVYPRQS